METPRFAVNRHVFTNCRTVPEVLHSAYCSIHDSASLCLGIIEEIVALNKDVMFREGLGLDNLVAIYQSTYPRSNKRKYYQLKVYDSKIEEDPVMCKKCRRLTRLSREITVRGFTKGTLNNHVHIAFDSYKACILFGICKSCERDAMKSKTALLDFLCIAFEEFFGHQIIDRSKIEWTFRSEKGQ